MSSPLLECSGQSPLTTETSCPEKAWVMWKKVWGPRTYWCKGHSLTPTVSHLRAGLGEECVSCLDPEHCLWRMKRGGERAESTPGWSSVVRVDKQDPALQLQGSEPRFYKMTIVGPTSQGVCCDNKSWSGQGDETG